MDTYATMSAIWNLIEAALDEASDPTDKLVAHIERRFGSHQADELTNWLVSNPAGDVQAYVRRTYVDPKADDLAAKVANFRNPKAYPMKGKQDEPDDDGGPQYVDPTQAKVRAAATAATAASRPDRAGVKANVDKPTGVGGSRDTKARDFQAMGTAGQNQAQDQPSLDGGKDTSITDKIAKLQALLNRDPRKPHPQADKIQRTIDKLEKMAAMAPDAIVPGNKPVPKTPETKELEKLNALLKNDKAIMDRVRKFVAQNPKVSPVEAKNALVKKIRDRIAELGRAGSSTIKKTQGMDADKFFKQGGAKVDPDAEVSVDKGPEGSHRGGLHKPDFDGQFIGQRWSPNAFTKPDDDEAGQNPDLDAARSGGLGKKRVQYGDAAIGQMGKGAVAANPAKPGKKWSDEHDMIWAGKGNGWVTKSQFLALAAQGKIRRKGSTDPSKPDLSKARVVSPVNSPSSRANLDNTTGKPIKQ